MHSAPTKNVIISLFLVPIINKPSLFYCFDLLLEVPSFSLLLLQGERIIKMSNLIKQLPTLSVVSFSHKTLHILLSFKDN